MRILSVTLAIGLFVASLQTVSARSTTRIYLSGTDSKATVPWEFKVSAGQRAGVWSTIPVPSNWEMHGFGTLSYHATEPSESGQYRHRISAPSVNSADRVYLYFDGVMTDATVRLNGQSVGEKHQGGFYRFSFDVTALLKAGQENLLEVDVDETSANAGVNKAERTGDYWNFGGIFRPVWLEVVPAQHLERIATDARADGSLRVHAFVRGAGGADQIRAKVTTLDGTLVGKEYSAKHDGNTTVLAWNIPGVKTWTAETPNLYQLEVSLIAPGGDVLHQLTERIGFRTFEVRKGDGLYLNGKKIVLKGVNRHSFNADTARCLTEEDHRTDIALMKEMNMNAVRMSHYPPDKRFLELCDELGLYVLDELAGWQKGYDTEVGRKLVRELVTRDVNHPCILFWDNGNEGGWNTDLDGDFAKWDPQGRAVLHPWGVINGVNTAHYKIFPHAQILAKGYTTSWNYDPKETPQMGDAPLIYMPTEFVHALYDGGAGAGLEDYWTMMKASPTLGGGFIWVFRDEGVRTDNGLLDVQNNKAPDGIVGPRGEREGSFFAVKELWSPVQLSAALPAKGNDLRITIANEYSFTNTNRAKYAWAIRKTDLRKNQSGVQADVLFKGDGALPDVEPGHRGEFSITLPNEWSSGDVLELKVSDPSGAELWTHSWPLPGLDALKREASSPAGGAGEVTLKDEGATIEMRTGPLTVRISRKTGMLEELLSGSIDSTLARGPRLAAGIAQLKNVTAKKDGRDAVVLATFIGDLEEVVWRLRPSGWLECSYTYRPYPDSTTQGVSFDLAESKVKAKRWLGEGPFRVWQNRMTGVRFGDWANDYNDTVTGWSGWTYPEFKGCFADVRWMELTLSRGALQIVPHASEQFVQVLKPSFAPDLLQANTRVQMAEAGLALLDAIPPIGSKFTLADKMGPQGEKPKLAPRYQRTVSFKFSE